LGDNKYNVIYLITQYTKLISRKINKLIKIIVKFYQKTIKYRFKNNKNIK